VDYLDNPGWHSGRASGLGVFEGDAVDLPGLGRQARRRSITGKFCFGVAPYTVQRHDCRGIIAVTVSRVHVIG
jgi:hypothetical protein